MPRPEPVPPPSASLVSSLDAFSHTMPRLTVEELEALERVGALNLLAEDVKDGVDKLSTYVLANLSLTLNPPSV